MVILQYYIPGLVRNVILSLYIDTLLGMAHSHIPPGGNYHHHQSGDQHPHHYLDLIIEPVDPTNHSPCPNRYSTDKIPFKKDLSAFTNYKSKVGIFLHFYFHLPSSCSPLMGPIFGFVKTGMSVFPRVCTKVDQKRLFILVYK